MPADPTRQNALCPEGIVSVTSYLTEKSGVIRLGSSGVGASLEFAEEGGAACVTRTRDPIITNDVLYQLS